MFLGRQTEIKQLEQYVKKKTSSLIVIKGRRRIGKSTLVENFAKKYKFMKFSGFPPSENTTRQSQLNEFSIQLGAQISIPGIKADD